MMGRLFTGSLLVSLALAGCGSSSSSSSAPAGTGTSTSTAAASASSPAATPPSGSGPLAVAESEYKLTPARATAHAGSVHIAVKNSGSIPHALSVDNAGPTGQDAKTALLSPGASTTLTVTLKRGRTYTWYCPVQGHRALGMQGTITVASDGSATTTTRSAGAAAPSSSAQRSY